MTGQLEIAAGSRGIGTFPEHWGLPLGRGNSEERASWVARNVATDEGLKRRGLNPAAVRSGKRASGMSARVALAKALALT